MLLGTSEGRRDHQGPADGPLRETLHKPGSRRPLPGRGGEGTTYVLTLFVMYSGEANLLILVTIYSIHHQFEYN